MTTRSITGAGVPYPSNHALAYDAANRLISATPQPSGSATTYGYDGHDRRVASTPPGGVTKLTMYSKAGQLLSEIRTNGSARVNYVYLGRHLLARVPYNSFGTGGGGLGSAPPKLFQHTDGLGTPIAVTDASGVLQGQRSVYEAYGDRVGVAEADGPGYTGHVADGLTGLTYMQARFYDPVAGRFLSIDPVAADVGNFNRYWYANNNPYKFVDPDGRNPVSPLDWYDFGKDVGSLVVNEIVYGAALVTGNADVQNLALDAMRDGALDAAASTAGLVSPKPGTGRDVKAAATILKAVDKANEVKRKIPASEKTARDMAKKIEKDLGKRARRDFHDVKESGSGDRTVDELKDDARSLYEQAGKEMPKWLE